MEKSFSSEQLVVQIFGNKPDIMAEAARIVEAKGAAILDLNFGCPAKKVVNKGGGAALLKDLPLMKEIAKAVVDAVSIPVMAKTRLGWNAQELIYQQAALNLQEVGIQALTIHARTRAQLFSGEADWDKIAELKNHPDFTIPLIGNGDIDSPEKAAMAFDKYEVDAVMIGRAAIGNPWIFTRVKSLFSGEEVMGEPSIEERIRVCKEHLMGTAEWKNERLAVLEMRKFYSGYFKGVVGFKPYKIMLMEALSFEEIFSVFEKIRNMNSDNS